MKKEYEEYSRKFKVGDVVRVAYTTMNDEEEWLNNVGMIERTDDFGNFNYCVDFEEFEEGEVWFNEASLEKVKITKPSDYEEKYEVGDRVLVDRVTEEDYLDKNWRTLGKEGVVKEKAPFSKLHYYVAFDDGTSAWVNCAVLKLTERRGHAEELPETFEKEDSNDLLSRATDYLSRATDYLARGNVYEWLEDELSCSIAVRLDMEDYEGVEKGASLLNELKRKVGDPLD